VKDRQLVAFRAVMLHGSITKAAEAIHLSQPAVSRYISDLEREVGFDLFVRRKEGSIPTPEAYSFFEEVQHSFAGIERLSIAAAEIRTSRKGHIKIATLPAASFDLVPSLTTAFLQSRPEIKVTLDVHTSSRISDLVASGQTHLGFAQLESTPTGIEVLGQYRSECVCVFPPDSPLSKRKAIEPKHLRDIPTIALAQHTLSSRYVDAAFLSQDIQPDNLMECQPSYVACCLAMRGAGAAIVDPLTAEFFPTQVLARRPFKPAIPFDFQIIRSAEATPSLVVHSFTETAVAHFDAHPKLSALP